MLTLTTPNSNRLPAPPGDMPPSIPNSSKTSVQLRTSNALLHVRMRIITEKCGNDFSNAEPRIQWRNSDIFDFIKSLVLILNQTQQQAAQ